MPAWVPPVFFGCAVVSLVASQRLVRALEAIGVHLGAPEVLLGLVAALAADGPELTSAVTAQAGGQHTIGVGVLLGSNVFNIAVLLGLGAAAAGGVRFHRRAVLLEGVTALGVAGAAVALVSVPLPAWSGLALASAFFVPYLAAAALPATRLPLPSSWCDWLASAVVQEGQDLSGTHHRGQARHLWPEAGAALLSLVAVVAASALMEHAAVVGGKALGLPDILVGAAVLAAVTSLPNAVAAVYLAGAGKGAAMLSEAMNSNTMNVVGGLIIPALVVGGAAGASHASFTGGAYLFMTALAIAVAYWRRGLGRWAGSGLLVLYGCFLVALVLTD